MKIKHGLMEASVEDLELLLDAVDNYEQATRYRATLMPERSVERAELMTVVQRAQRLLHRIQVDLDS